MEPSPKEYANIGLGRRSVALVNTGSTVSVRHLSNRELLWCYSIPDSLSTPEFDTLSHTYWLDNAMQSCIPFNLCSFITEQLTEHTGFADDMLYEESESSDTYQCYQMIATLIALK